MKTINTIEIYEQNGVETPIKEKTFLTVSNHWNRKCFVVLELGEVKVTVSADELKRAIANAQNAHNF